jgi:polynucleotide kinase-phosphatase
MEVRFPELALVVLIGTSGSGKSTFARRHFLPTEVISSDYCRGLVADDENDQSATGAAFEVLHFIAGKRLAVGRLTVVDATNVRAEDRKPLIELARQHHMLPVALVFDLPEPLCQERNRSRPDRSFGPHVIRSQRQALRSSLRGLQREGFRHVTVFRSAEEVDAATLVREPLWNNKRGESGPLDIIGDVHGCYDELHELLLSLGYLVDASGDRPRVTHPQGRKAVFVGDLVDRGPKTPAVLQLVMGSVTAGTAYCVAGNHDVKLARKLHGRDVKLTHGLAESMQQLETQTAEFRSEVANFLDKLVSHYVFDAGRLVVAHAGLREEMHGRGSAAVRAFAMYGETTGETDEYGLPVRYNWAADYRGRATVVYGHTPVPYADWLNSTICIDTGCVFGGKLTALRYPERELVSVPARQTYYEPARPLNRTAQTPAGSAQQQYDDLLSVQDVLGKRHIETSLERRVAIREVNATAALEVMSRFAANPKWLIYLPPTMSPSETHREGDLLEHPAEAFTYFRSRGIRTVVCEQKHMGSRAVVVVCKDEETARRRFGVEGEGQGIVYTRTGRRFFNQQDTERALLTRVATALEASGLFAELASDWVALDCELMPWSAKAQDLIRQQYAAVGAAGIASTAATVEALSIAARRLPELGTQLAAVQSRRTLITQYIDAYRRYCWPTQGLDGLKLAPFHLLASEGHVHSGRNHEWHMTTLARLASADARLLMATPFRVVDLESITEVAAAIDWWLELTAAGGEGMVVKPLDFVARNERGLLQPALKCRGREYLRIIYGPEYDLPRNLERLRHRGLAAKRSLAEREFCLGIEALTRFVNGQPLRLVHECVFGVLALESEPVDPRL